MLAQQVQLRLELAYVLGAGYEYLDNLGLRLPGGVSKHVGIYRDLPYMEESQPGFLRLLPDYVHIAGGQFLVFGQEHQAGAVFEPLGNRDALEQDELVRNLYQDSRAVTALVVGGLGPTVLHVLEHR